MRLQRLIELVGNGIGQATLTDSNDRLVAMGLGTEVTNLRTGEHQKTSQASHMVEEPASVARDGGAAVAAIKRELGALVIVGALSIPLVALWLDGVRELAVLAGYGLGAALWIHARGRGLLYAMRGRRRDGVDGP